MSDIQKNWKKLEEVLGEEDARKEVSRQLRLFADLVEKNGYPDIYGVELLSTGSKGMNDIMGHISVTLSYPWPG